MLNYTMQYSIRLQQVKNVLITLARVVCLASCFAVSVNAAERLNCPSVMVTQVDKAAHAGWFVYSNEPLRLAGSSIQYVVDGHLEATLDPVREARLNDEQLTKESVFRLSAHSSDEPFLLVCYYGAHAQLSREIPSHISECKVLHHERFTDTEFEVSCH